MPAWLGYLLALAAFLVLAPLLGWLGHKHGRSIKGGVAMASLMLGMGAMFDAPVKAALEAQEAQVKGDEENGEPPDPDVAPPKPSDG